MPVAFWLWIGAIALLLALPAVVAVRTARLKPRTYRPLSRPACDPASAARAAESLAAAIRFQTVIRDSTPDTGEWVRLREYLRSRYPLCHEKLELEHAGGYSLLYRWPAAGGPAGDAVLLCAHMDVVPADGPWTAGPFDGLIRDGFVWGRGAIDCKSTLICLLEAVEALLGEGFAPGRDIYLAFGHDEEVGGQDGARNIARLLRQRGVRFSLILDEGCALVRAPLATGRPVAEVAVTEKGMVNLRMTLQSPSGHASTPPRHTALGKLSEAVTRIEFRQFKARLTPVVRDALIELAPALSYKHRMMLANLWLFRRRLLKLLAADPGTNALIRTTLAATMSSSGSAPNVLPRSAEATFNVRLLHGDDEASLLAYLRDVTRGLDAEFEILHSGAPSAVADYRGTSFALLAGVIKDTFGDVDVVPFLMAGGTDARHYEGLSDCVLRFWPFILTPEELETIHSEDERILCDALGVAAGFFRTLIERL